MKEYKGYIGSVAYSAADKILFGKIEGINDLVNYEADNVNDLEKEFKEAVDDYLITKEIKICDRCGRSAKKYHKDTEDDDIK